MVKDLKILYPSPLFPASSGGALRALGIARLAQRSFGSVRIYCLDDTVHYNGLVDGVSIYQDNKYIKYYDKFFYYLNGMISRNWSLNTSEHAFKEKGDSIYQLESPYYYNLIKKRNIKNFIINEYNVMWELLEFPANSSIDWLNKLINSKRDKFIEEEALKEATQIIICSERDKQKFVENIRDIEDKITIIPNCVDFKKYLTFLEKKPMICKDESKKKVLFIGNLNYSPNIDAVHSICNDIAPYGNNDVEFTIIGKNPPNIRKTENVIFKGYVKDILSEMLQSDICIAPLKYGSGTRLKILEYMAMGKPVISTSKGAEGIEYTDGRDIIIEDNIKNFSGKITDLLNMPSTMDNLGINAQNLIQKKYDWERYRKKLDTVYESCM